MDPPTFRMFGWKLQELLKEKRAGWENICRMQSNLSNANVSAVHKKRNRKNQT